MNHIFEISNSELIQFVFSFNFMIQTLELTSTTVDGICHNLQEACNDVQSFFPQEGPFQACAFISTKHQCSMDDISQIQDTFSVLPNIEVMHCDLKTYCDNLADDELYKIRIVMGDTGSRGQQYVDSLIKRANNDNEYAACLLGLDDESYSGIITFGRMSETFDVKHHVLNLLYESAGNISHLTALAAAFFHGIVVEKDQRMASILLDCAIKVRALYNDDELEERDSWLDPDAEQYYFFSDDPADRLYVLDWIDRQAQSDTIFQSLCAWLMEYYDREKIGVG